MIEKIGRQIREPIEETEYKVQFRDEHITVKASGFTCFEFGPDAVLLNAKTGKTELWQENDDYAGYVLVIDDKGFEFVRELS